MDTDVANLLKRAEILRLKRAELLKQSSALIRSSRDYFDQLRQIAHANRKIILERQTRSYLKKLGF